MHSQLLFGRYTFPLHGEGARPRADEVRERARCPRCCRRALTQHAVRHLRHQPRVTGEWNFASATDELFSRDHTGLPRLGCGAACAARTVVRAPDAARCCGASAAWHAWQLFVACIPGAGVAPVAPPRRWRHAAAKRAERGLTSVWRAGVLALVSWSKSNRAEREQARRPACARSSAQRAAAAGFLRRDGARTAAGPGRTEAGACNAGAPCRRCASAACACADRRARRWHSRRSSSSVRRRSARACCSRCARWRCSRAAPALSSPRRRAALGQAGAARGARRRVGARWRASRARRSRSGRHKKGCRRARAQDVKQRQPRGVFRTTNAPVSYHVAGCTGGSFAQRARRCLGGAFVSSGHVRPVDAADAHVLHALQVRVHVLRPRPRPA